MEKDNIAIMPTQGAPPTPAEQAEAAYAAVMVQNQQQQMAGVINQLQILQCTISMGIANGIFPLTFLKDVKKRCLQLAASTEDAA